MTSTTSDIPKNMQWTLDGSGLNIDAGDLEGVLWSEEKGDILSIELMDGEDGGLALSAMTISRSSSDEQLSFAGPYPPQNIASSVDDELGTTQLSFTAETIYPQCQWGVVVLADASGGVKVSILNTSIKENVIEKVARGGGSGGGGGFSNLS